MILYIIVIIILLFIIVLILNFTLFLENYLFIEKNFLDNNDIIELYKIVNNPNNIFLENNKKKYILFDKNNKIYNIIYNNDKLKKIIKSEFNVDIKYPSYNIEYRIYKQNNNSMGWHQDYKILNKNYLECIYIIENTSNNLFRWFKNFQFHNYLQQSNDLIILKPNDLIHNIDPILYGEKRILKFIIDLE